MVTEYLLKVNHELGKTVIMVTHDSNVARVADQIMKIEDGTITVVLTPSQIDGHDVSSSCIEQLRKRKSELAETVTHLEQDFKAGRMSSDDFANRHLKLKQIQAGIDDELQSHGVIG